VCLYVGTNFVGRPPTQRPASIFPDFRLLGVAALDAAALCGPIDEALQLVAMPPTELQEFSGVEIRGFLTKKGFQTPLDVGATPRCEAIAARGDPIITERSNHSCTSIWPGYLV
jgi:hypothetical protein